MTENNSNATVTNSTANTRDIVAIGHRENQELCLWIPSTKQKYDIPMSSFGKDTYKLLTGKDIDSESFEALRNSVIMECSKLPISSLNTIGAGVHRMDGTNIVISGNNAFVEGNEIIEEPFYAGKFLDYDPAIDWYFPPDEAAEEPSLQELYGRLKQHNSQWNFENEEMLPILTALMMLAPMQRLMYWRPTVYLSGPQGSGKTTLFDFMGDLYGPLATRLDDTTSYAIFQELGNNGRIGLIDEFEKSKKRADILESLKKSNLGGSIVRGTTGKTTLRYSIESMVWLSSIEIGVKDAAQRARMVVVNLDRNSGKRLAPIVEHASEFKTLRSAIVSRVLQNWDKIEAFVNEVRNDKNKYGPDGRTVDNYVYAAALISLCEPGRNPFPEYINDVAIQQDEEELIRDILSSLLCNGSNPITVAQALRDCVSQGKQQLAKDLDMHGMKIVSPRTGSDKGKQFVAIYTPSVKKHFLRKTRWADLNIEDILLRAEGASRKKQRIAGMNSTNCIMLPYEVCFPESEEDAE